MPQYYCSVGGQQQGPFDGATLKRMATEGRLSPSDLVWAEGQPDWVPAVKVRGLFPPPGIGSPAVAPAASAIVERDVYTCDQCGGQFGIDEVYGEAGGTICKRCHTRRAAIIAAASGRGAAAETAPATKGRAVAKTAPVRPNYASAAPAGAGGDVTGLIIGGYVCAVVSLFFCPIGFGCAAVSLGVRCINRGAKGNGIAIIILGVLFGVASWMIGMAIMMGRH